MQIGSTIVSSRPGPPGGFPHGEDSSGADLVGACLIKAFSFDPETLPAIDWASTPAVRVAAPAPGAATAAPARRKPAQPDSGERRGEDRSKVSVYRSAMLHWESVEVLCLMRNVSSGGMMGKLLLDLPVGTRVLVEMRSGHEIAGHVVWARDQMVGVQFDASIDVQQVINGAHSAVPEWRQRLPRVHVPCSATLIGKSGPQTVQLIDLSQGGAKVEGDLLREGDDVTLAVKGLEAHRGTVRWAKDGRAGIAFLAAIPFDALAFWALDRQAEMGRIERLADAG